MARMARMVTAAGLTVLAAAAGTPAAMAENVFDIGPSATLVARGAAVDVSVTYSCPPTDGEGAYSDLWVRVTQVVRGQQVVQAERTIAPTCDGTEQTALVRVTAMAGAGAFKSGPAAVDGALYWSSWYEYFVIQDAQEVRISR